MKYFIKKIYFILFLVSILFLGTGTYGKDTKVEYSRNNISNYLSGIVSVNQDDTNVTLELELQFHLSKPGFERRCRSK